MKIRCHILAISAAIVTLAFGCLEQILPLTYVNSHVYHKTLPDYHFPHHARLVV